MQKVTGWGKVRPDQKPYPDPNLIRICYAEHKQGCRLVIGDKGGSHLFKKACQAMTLGWRRDDAGMTPG